MGGSTPNSQGDRSLGGKMSSSGPLDNSQKWELIIQGPSIIVIESLVQKKSFNRKLWVQGGLIKWWAEGGWFDTSTSNYLLERILIKCVGNDWIMA
jgi:hypothetical protein